MIRLPLVSGLVWSDMLLADTLRPGRYRIIAYTNWMRNAGPEYFFDQPVTIINTAPDLQGPIGVRPRKIVIRKRKEANKADIQFFPESGSLVNGIRSKVAFKATGENGLSMDASGVVTDDSGQQITMFKSEHLGMGLFYLTPEPGKSYKASVEFADGTQCVISLPVAVDKGFVMNINNSDTSFIRVTVTASKSALGDPQQYGEINLIAQAGGKVYYTAKSKVTSAPLVAVIPKSKFPSGIVQFTLFSAKGEPLNERIAFIEWHDQLSLNLAPDKANGYTSRGKIRININSLYSAGKPATGSFSAAVVNESFLPGDAEAGPTIFSHLLLTSDLKGYIEKPGYYFSNNENARADLDVLMLTQGYRHFEWKKMLNGGQEAVKYMPEKTLSVSGHVRTPGGKPVVKAKVSLLSTRGGYMLLDTVTDQQGRFVFDRLMVVDSLACKIQARTTKDSKNVVVTIDDSPPQLQHYEVALTNDSLMPARLPVKQTSSVQQSKIPANGHSKLLKEVVIKAEKPLLKNSSNLNGSGNADQVLLEKDLNQAGGDIASRLVGRLTGIFFRWDPQKWILYPCMYQNGNIVIPKIMVDGVEMKAEILNTLPPEIVESVEVLRSSNYTSMYGWEGYNGLILINTKKGNYGGSEATNIASYTINGYHKALVFYSPKYDHPKTDTEQPDQRSTVYWNPNVVTDKDGKASFEYYNGDTKGTYRLIVEGIDENGKIGRAVFRYTVQ
jgi:hypothetical protein